MIKSEIKFSMINTVQHKYVNLIAMQDITCFENLVYNLSYLRLGFETVCQMDAKFINAKIRKSGVTYVLLRKI